MKDNVDNNINISPLIVTYNATSKIKNPKDLDLEKLFVPFPCVTDNRDLIKVY